MDLEFYSCDTGKELDETYQLVKNLEVYLGIKIKLLQAAENSSEDPFDHFLKMYGAISTILKCALVHQKVKT